MIYQVKITMYHIEIMIYSAKIMTYGSTSTFVFNLQLRASVQHSEQINTYLINVEQLRAD